MLTVQPVRIQVQNNAHDKQSTELEKLVYKMYSSIILSGLHFINHFYTFVSFLIFFTEMREKKN